MKISIHDAEHWITVHPNGREDKGSPLLISGSNGHYTVVGGAGGKLNGKTVNPKSMSKGKEGGTESNTQATQGNQGTQAPANTTAPAAAPNATSNTTAAPTEGKTETKTETAAQHPHDVQEHSIADIEKMLRGEGAEIEVIGKVINELKSNAKFAPKNSGEQYAVNYWSKNQVKAALNEVHNKSVMPAPPNAPTNPMRARYEEKKAAFEAAANKANELSANAKTLEEHKAAMAAHETAYLNYKPWSISARAQLNHHATEYHKHKKEIKRLEKEAKKGQPRVKREAPKGVSFAKSSVEEVKAHFTKEWNMGFDNGVKKGAALAYAKEHNIWSHSSASSEEEKKKHSEEYLRLREHERSDPSYGLRGHTPIDINGTSASSKAMREMLTHVDNALKQLEASGFNPKTALKKAQVSFVAGTTGRANGHAWGGNMMGEGTKGYFSVSPFKRGSFNEEQAAMHKARMDAGKPRWSISSSEADQTRGTIVHEMAHALGMREGVESPKRLAKILDEVLPKMGYSERKKWITENISEYATKNIKETDAELSAMVTAPDYKWGTLPKQLEDHVKWLWDYKEK